jgi:hypothetical protein
MTNLGGVVQMLRKEQARLSKDLNAIGAALSAFGAAYANGTATRRKISAAGRAKVKVQSGKANVVTVPKKRAMSASARQRIAAAQRARWAKMRAAKKSA